MAGTTQEKVTLIKALRAHLENMRTILDLVKRRERKKEDILKYHLEFVQFLASPNRRDISDEVIRKKRRSRPPREPLFIRIPVNIIVNSLANQSNTNVNCINVVETSDVEKNPTNIMDIDV